MKCDGNDNCSKCVKKGIECKYGQEESQRAESPDQSESHTNEPSSVEESSDSKTATDQNHAVSRLTVPALSKTGVLDWTTIQIRPDPQAENPTEVGIDRAESQKYLDVYFARFHDRWPIVHRPSFGDEEVHTDLCELSMRVIGGWLLGTTESIQFAVETHAILVDHIMSQLVCQRTDMHYTKLRRGV